MWTCQFDFVSITNQLYFIDEFDNAFKRSPRKIAKHWQIESLSLTTIKTSKHLQNIMAVDCKIDLSSFLINADCKRLVVKVLIDIGLSYFL